MRILAMIVVGKAEKPVLINIKDKIAIEDALPFGALYRRSAQPDQTGGGDERASVILIGPAGENLVPLGCVISRHRHAAGRTGMGAVMGSKI